jgi:hypothetical protein
MRAGSGGGGRGPRDRGPHRAGLSQPADDVRGAMVELGDLALAVGVPALGARDRLIEQREALLEVGLAVAVVVPITAAMAATVVEAP